MLTTTVASAGSVKMPVSVGLLGGLGWFTQVPKDGIGVRESPIGVKLAFNVGFRPDFQVGLEHVRSYDLSHMTTGAGITQFTLRYYPFLGQPVAYTLNDAEVGYARAGLACWLGAGLGAAQGTIKDNSAFGFIASPSAGADWYWGNSWFLRAEASHTYTLMGSGSIEALTALVGLFYIF